jgi:hypothetical protein
VSYEQCDSTMSPALTEEVARKTYSRSTRLPFLLNMFSCFRSVNVIHRVSCTQTNILSVQLSYIYKDKHYFSFIVKFSFISRSSVLTPPLYHPLN